MPVVTCCPESYRVGEEAKLFTEIQNVRRESREGYEKDNEKQRFPFMSEAEAVMNDSHPHFRRG